MWGMPGYELKSWGAKELLTLATVNPSEINILMLFGLIAHTG